MTSTCRTPTRKAWLWRWRRNPLRRRSDLLEAWIVLIAWLLAVVAGVAAGWAAGALLEQGIDARRTQVHPVSAVLTRDAPRNPVATTAGAHEDTVWAKVRWTAADGSLRTGSARVEPGSTAGTAVTVWTDRTGALTARPPTAVEARTHVVAVGTSAGLAAGAAVLGCGRLARLALDRRRLREWEAQWARVGPQWRRKMSG